MPFWVKPLQMDLGCSLVWVAHAILDQTIANGDGLLMTFWVKLVQMDMGCSLVWVAHAILGQNCTKRTWVALQYGLLKLFWVKLLQKGCGLLFSMGCSCQNTLLCKATEPTLIAGLLGLLMGCSVALQVDPNNSCVSWCLMSHIK